MEIKELEAVMKTAVENYRAEYQETLKQVDQMIESVLTSGETFKIFWLGEQLRARLGLVADHLCTLKGIMESRN